jgi:ADP-ribose pyrophosphatase YjhB (NUDIX family)
MSQEKRFKVCTAAYLVLIKDDKVLLSKRANTGYQDGNYSLVSGHLEKNETAEQCIIRESLEEVNIKVKLDDLKVKHVMHYRQLQANKTYFDIFLTAYHWEGDLINMEEDKCDEIRWFSLDELPSNMAPEVKLALKNIKNNIFYGELGW